MNINHWMLLARHKVLFTNAFGNGHMNNGLKNQDLFAY